MGLNSAAEFAAARSAAAAALDTSKRLVPSHGGGGKTPKLPSGPPGNAGAGAVAGGLGGAAFGVWCVLLLGCVLSLASELRRHHVRLRLPVPSGAVFLLQRPG
jgi:hypothetical protein